MGKKEYIIFLGMIFELVTLVLLFLYAGRYVDQKLGWSGIGVTAGGILAIVVWIFHLYFALKVKDDQKS